MATGLEPLFTIIQGSIKSDFDVLVCSVHWALISSGFKAIGAGETLPADCSLVSELLPSGWNDNQECYSIYYSSSDGGNYMLKAIPIGSTILVHLMRLSDDKVTNVTLDVADYCTGDNSSFRRAYRNTEQLLASVRRDIVSPLKGGGSKVEVAETRGRERRSPEGDESGRQRDPLRVDRRPPQQYIPQRGDPVDPFSIGRRDLDPLAHGGGGMMMDPFRSGGGYPFSDPSAGLPQRLPRGAVPPGARFDPFGPPDIDRPGQFRQPPSGGSRRGRPGSSDEFLPPDFEDDLYM